MGKYKMERIGNKMVSMFTYGILKFPYNIQREGGKNIVENSTVSGHQMFLYNHSFPITQGTGNPDDVIYGTLFDVPEWVVKRQYDITEGYSEYAPKETNMYNREKVQVKKPDGTIVEAFMYIANPLFFEGWFNQWSLIPTGNYTDAVVEGRTGTGRRRR